MALASVELLTVLVAACIGVFIGASAAPMLGASFLPVTLCAIRFP